MKTWRWENEGVRFRATLRDNGDARLSMHQNMNGEVYSVRFDVPANRGAMDFLNVLLTRNYDAASDYMLEGIHTS